tara:strand:- start:190 stop:444 length:255 start_codon:yes stop_codon:yes gene_type:complete
MQWGGKADATDSYAMYDLAHAAGINFFDTAHGHTGGASETLQGEFVRRRSKRPFHRHEVRLTHDANYKSYYGQSWMHSASLSAW